MNGAETSIPGKSAVLAPVDMEFLERLCLRREGILHEDCIFPQAQTLLRTGHAKVARTWTIQGKTLRLIVPTKLGDELALERSRRHMGPAI